MQNAPLYPNRDCSEKLINHPTPIPRHGLLLCNDHLLGGARTECMNDLTTFLGFVHGLYPYLHILLHVKLIHFGVPIPWQAARGLRFISSFHAESNCVFLYAPELPAPGRNAKWAL